MKVKSFATDILGRPPLSTLFRASAAARPLVVLYHGVTNRKEFSGTENYRGKHIHVEDFRAQLLFLKKYFHIVSLAEIEAIQRGEHPRLDNACAITFDDGYKNNYQCAFPVLKELSIPATFFLTGAFIEGGEALWIDRLEYALNNSSKLEYTIPALSSQPFSVRTYEEKILLDAKLRQYLKGVPHQERLKQIELIESWAKVVLQEHLQDEIHYAPLTWYEITEMKEYGMNFGAHTMNHPILSKESAQTQEEEITQSITLIRERLGECAHFAYPNGQPGDWDAESEKAIKKNALSGAWTTRQNRVQKNDSLFALPRITLDNTRCDSRFRALVSNSLPSVKKFLRL